MEAGKLAVYVTSHGFGHLNRVAAVINRIPHDVPITIRCHSNLFNHWHERLRRPADLEFHVSDAGAVNPPGDSATTDGVATLELAAQTHSSAMSRIDEDVERLSDGETAAVLCDAPPVPLIAARRAGVPGFLLANFTWADIYEPHAKRIGGDALTMVRELRKAYAQATTVFHSEPGLRMRQFSKKQRVEVGMVVTPGRQRKEELRRQLSLSNKAKLVYFYIGRYGQENLGWERVKAFGDKGIHFVGFHNAPVSSLPNLHVVSADDWTGADLAASVDVIMAKAGYGTACEAMVARTPMIYPPRSGFAEHRVLDRALKTWGAGLPASARDFAAFRVEKQLEQAFTLKPGPPPFPADGAAIIAERLTRVCRESALQNHMRSS